MATMKSSTARRMLPEGCDVRPTKMPGPEPLLFEPSACSISVLSRAASITTISAIATPEEKATIAAIAIQRVVLKIALRITV